MHRLLTTFSDRRVLCLNFVELLIELNRVAVTGCQMEQQIFESTGHILCMAATPTGFYAGRKDGLIMQIFGWDIVASEYEVRDQVYQEILPYTCFETCHSFV